LSGGLPYPETDVAPEEEEEVDAFDRLSDALLDRSDDEPDTGDLAAFEEMAKSRLAEWMKEETPEGGRSEGSERFNELLTDWIDAIRHYDSTVAFEPASHNRELTVVHLKKLQEILKKLEENAQQLQALPSQGEGEGEPQGQEGEGGEEGEAPGSGEEGDEESGGEKGEEPGDGGDQGDEPKPDEGDGDEKSKEPKPGETPEEAARRILSENADLQKGALSPGRIRFRRPDKDW
jgi:hypothetical protein